LLPDSKYRLQIHQHSKKLSHKEINDEQKGYKRPLGKYGKLETNITWIMLHVN